MQAGNSTNTTLQISNVAALASKIKLGEDAYLSWRLSKQNETLYSILENNREYTNWITKTKRWFTSDECARMIDLNFKDNQVNIGANNLLFQAQKNHIASVLERLLQTSEGKRLTRKHPDNP